MEKQEVVTKQVKKIVFGIVSPQIIKKIGRVNVISPELYDADGYPVEKGLMDPAMGTIDPGLRCKTCGSRLKQCLGHFGYVRLAKPVVHVLYKGLIYDLLRAFCKDCGRIKTDVKKYDSLKAKVEQARLEKDFNKLRALQKLILTSAKKVKKCPHCDNKPKDIKIDKPTTFVEGDKRIWPTELRERLEKMPNNDLELAGFDTTMSRPEWMIVTLLPVPPITVRPSITLETGERSEDDLTHKLSDIIRVNQRLFENINAGAPEIIVEDLWDLLQYHITTFFDNSVTQIPPARHKSNRPLKTLAQRLKGKEGRFRSNLAGKRVNFSARSLISPDAFIEIDEVGVPLKVAKELTIPERVNEWNIDWLKKFINNLDSYPGANYVITPEGRRKKITAETKEQIMAELQPGWLVERNLLDGDVGLFNRQPTLHKQSIMGHRVKVLPGKTFRLNPAVTVPYAADFDGDEMNFHLPQTEESRAEAEHILGLGNQIITPRYGSTIMGIVEDSLFGLYLLVKYLNLTKQEASEILIAAGLEDFELPKQNSKGLYFGKEIFSLLLPNDFTFEKNDLKIKNGIIVEGDINSKMIGPEGGSLLHRLYIDYGAEKTKKIINTMNYLGLAVSRRFLATVSLYDLDTSDFVKNKVTKIIESGIEESEKILEFYHSGKIRALPGKTIRETMEANVLNALNILRSKAAKVIEADVSEFNNISLLAKSGTSGRMLNLTQMAGLVGQQALRGKRIEKGYSNRTLSLFKQGDLSAKAHGFVANNYVIGMDPIETFFNAVVGRDSLMDTAMRTPKSGYMQRRMINALQDYKVEYDGTIRDAGRKIIQFSFGGDGIDVGKSDQGGIKIG